MKKDMLLTNLSTIEKESESRLEVEKRWYRGAERDVLTVEPDLPFVDNIQGILSLDDVADTVEEAIEQIKEILKQPFIYRRDLVLDIVSDKQKILSRLHRGLANSSSIPDFEHNKVLYLPIIDTDLLLYFYFTVEEDTDGLASVKLRFDMDISWEEAIKASAENDILRSKLKGIGTILSEMSGLPEDEFPTELDHDLLVLTNTMNVRGASLITIPEAQERLYNLLGDDFRIIPSSIHEVIVFSKDCSFAAQDIANMIRNVNETTVEERDRLSDHLYACSREKGIYVVA